MTRPRLEQQFAHPHERFWLSGLVVRFAAEHGLPREAQRRLSLVVAELACNACTHARGGRLVLEIEVDVRAALLTVDDEGPGITSPSLAVCDGWSEERWLTPDVPWSTRRGLGTGLGAVARLVDVLEITHHGGGARVFARIEPRRET